MEEVEGTGLYYWTASGTKADEKNPRWRKNIFMRIIAPTFEDAVRVFRQRYPDAKLHNVSHAGEVHAIVEAENAGRPGRD